MRIGHYTCRLEDIQPGKLTVPARDAVISIICRLNNIRKLREPSDAWSDAAPYEELTRQIVAGCLSGSRTAPAATVSANLQAALNACHAQQELTYGEEYDQVLDSVFEFLDNEVLRAPVDASVATLIVQLLSVCSLPDGGDKEYLAALEAHIEDALPRLEADILPLASLPYPHHQVPTEAETSHLVSQMNEVSLILLSGYLLQDRHRLRVLPLYDILRRYVPNLLTPYRYDKDAIPEAPFDSADRKAAQTHIAQLLSAYARLVYSDLIGTPSTYYNLLATIANQGLAATADQSDAWWQYLDVLAQATDEYENAKYNSEIDNPFEPPPM